MSLTNDNYFSPSMTSQYWSVSLFKAFNKCEACGLAQARNEYEREMTDALLIGSYVDAYFSGEMEKFTDKYGLLMFKKNGELLAKFDQANKIIETILNQPLMMDFLCGDKQVVMTADLFGVPWKGKIDVLDLDKGRIVDLKCVRNFDDVYDSGYGWRSWIEYWGYDIQGAIYQKLVEENTGKKLPFYIVAATKEKVPDKKIIQIPQHILDAAYKLVEAKIDRFDLVKSGELDSTRCEKCKWCRQTKVLTVPEIYEIKEAV